MGRLLFSQLWWKFKYPNDTIQTFEQIQEMNKWGKVWCYSSRMCGRMLYQVSNPKCNARTDRFVGLLVLWLEMNMVLYPGFGCPPMGVLSQSSNLRLWCNSYSTKALIIWRLLANAARNSESSFTRVRKSEKTGGPISIPNHTVELETSMPVEERALWWCSYRWNSFVSGPLVHYSTSNPKATKGNFVKQLYSNCYLLQR